MATLPEYAILSGNKWGQTPFKNNAKMMSDPIYTMFKNNAKMVSDPIYTFTQRIYTTLGEQIVDAARFYLDVYNANPNAGISFTGHSLGGGLAALMAVYFDRAAQTFDPAPFARSVDSSAVVNELKSRLGELGYVQAGNAGMNATDALNYGAFMLGSGIGMIHAANDANYDNSFERSAA